MNKTTRTLEIYADGIRIAEGCPIHLSGRAEMSLRPLNSVLQIGDLSESSRSLLRQSRSIRVCHEDSILAEGHIRDVFTSPGVGRFPSRGSMACAVREKRGARALTNGPDEVYEVSRIFTTVIFSDTAYLHDIPISVSIPAGISCSDMLRLLLSASGTGIPLLFFSGTDMTLSRPRVFFGSLPEALNAVAALAGARSFLTPSGLVVLSADACRETVDIPESDLLAEPMPTRYRIVLSVPPKGWPVGATAKVHYKDRELTGRILERATEADNRGGPWFSQLILEESNQ